MRLYKNGDRCPCCGTVLTGKSARWLAEFSQLAADLGLTEWPQPEMRAAEGGDLIRRCGATFPVRGEGKEAEP